MGMKVKIRQVCLQLMMLLMILVPLSNPLFLMVSLVHASSNGHFQVTGQPTGFQLGEAYGNNDNGVQLMIDPEKNGTYTNDSPKQAFQAIRMSAFKSIGGWSMTIFILVAI